jgi:hypothetical protein
LTEVPQNNHDDAESGPSIGSNNQKINSEGECCRAKTENQKTKRTWLEKTAVAIAILAFFAAAGQFWTASDTEKRSLRAYVSVNSIMPQLKTAPIGINVFVQNGGQTPAYNVHVHLSWEPMPIGEKLPAGFGYPDKGDADLARSSLAILSGGSGSKEFPFTIPFDHDEVFSKVESHANEGYFYGHVDYDYIFDGHWLTEICYRYTFEGTPENGRHILSLGHDHNQAKPRHQN